MDGIAPQKTQPSSFLLGACLHLRNGRFQNLERKDQLSRGGVEWLSVFSLQIVPIFFKNSVFSKEQRDWNSDLSWWMYVCTNDVWYFVRECESVYRTKVWISNMCVYPMYVRYLCLCGFLSVSAIQTRMCVYKCLDIEKANYMQAKQMF